MASPPQATPYLSEIIDYLTEEIIFAKFMHDRYEKWEIVEFFWDQLPVKPSHGRLFARYKLAKMMTAVAHTDPYSLEHPVVVSSAKKKKSLLSPPLSLVQWTPHHWKDLMNLLQITRDILLRQDADMLQGENDEDNDERAESDLYNQKMERLITYIRINQALADFRATLQEQLVDKDASVKVDPSVLAKFGEIVEQNFSNESDERNRQALESLLVRGKPNTSTRSHGVSLVSPDELRSILAKKPFCLATLSHRLTLLLQRWARDVFANKPTLTRLGYVPNMLIVTSTTVAVKEEESDSEEEQEDVKQPARQSSPMPVIAEESEDNDENETPSPEKDVRRPKRKRDTSVDPNLEKLKSARRDLQKDGKDPMQEIQRIAATATRTSPRTARLIDKKKSATRVQFGDSDEDDSDNEEGARAQLSEMPTRAKLPTPKSKSPKATKVTGGKQKRVPFSNEEKTAIRRGVEKFGVGHWSEIKSEYAVILRNRTSVNIKDCYRTMKNKGEL